GYLGTHCEGFLEERMGYRSDVYTVRGWAEYQLGFGSSGGGLPRRPKLKSLGRFFIDSSQFSVLSSQFLGPQFSLWRANLNQDFHRLSVITICQPRSKVRLI